MALSSKNKNTTNGGFGSSFREDINLKIKLFRLIGTFACLGLAFSVLISMSLEAFGEFWSNFLFLTLGGLLLVSIVVCRQEFKEAMLSNRFRIGVNVSVQAIFGLVGLGLFFYIFGAKLYTRWDIASERAYRLSDQSLQILSDLKSENVKKVEVVYLQNELPDSYSQSSRIKQTREMVKRLMEEYQYHADELAPKKFEFRILDIQTSPDELKDISERTKIETFSVRQTESVLIMVGDKYQLIPAARMFRKVSPRPGAPSQIMFRGEQICSSYLRILSRPQTDQPTVYFTIGHGERSISSGEDEVSYLCEQLRMNSFEVQSLDLTKQTSVPLDSKVVVICGPKKAFRPEEIGRLQEYLFKKNGRVLIMVDPVLPIYPDEAKERFPGLSRLMGLFAIQLKQDYEARVYRPAFGDPEMQLKFPGYPGKLVELLLREPNSKYRRESVQLRRPCVLEIDNKSNTKMRGFSARPILQSTSYQDKHLKTWAEPVGKESSRALPSDVSLKGPLILAAVGSEIDPIQFSKEKKGMMIAVADSNVASNKLFNPNPQNQQFIMECLYQLIGANDLINIPMQDLEERRIKVQPQEMKFLGVLLGIGLPLVFAFWGILVWALRRT